MAVFRENSGSGDRSAGDRKRHRELVEESIKKNIGGVIADESIIDVSKEKKVKIPIRSKNEPQFRYGKNQKGTGSGDGNQKRGDKIGEDGQKGGSGNQGAGDQEGEVIIEIEVTMEQLINYLFDDLKLPDLDRRKLSDIDSVSFRKLGYQTHGIPPRLAKRRSVIENIKREQAEARGTEEEEDIERCNTGEESEDLPFKEDDLRYSRMRTENKKNYNAVVFCIMDVSGSMDQTKKYLARSFYFLLYQFLKLKYATVKIVFIAHTTTAKEVTEDEFFHRGESGGTKISSGYEKTLEIIQTRFTPSNWNIYAFHCSDGDNWDADNDRAVKLANELCEVCNMFGYVEIPLDYYGYSATTIRNRLSRDVRKKNFHLIEIKKKEDVYPGLKKLLVEEGR